MWMIAYAFSNLHSTHTKTVTNSKEDIILSRYTKRSRTLSIVNALRIFSWACTTRMMESYIWCWCMHHRRHGAQVLPAFPGWDHQHFHASSGCSQSHHHNSLKHQIQKQSFYKIYLDTKTQQRRATSWKLSKYSTSRLHHSTASDATVVMTSHHSSCLRRITAVRRWLVCQPIFTDWD